MADYWKDNGIEKPQQVVVCAACFDKTTGTLILGPRHWDDLMRDHYHMLPESVRPKAVRMEQGFIDQFGAFLTREEAFQIVQKNGQPFDAEANSHGRGKELFSEGLY